MIGSILCGCQSSAYRFTVMHNPNGQDKMTGTDGLMTAEITTDAYHYGMNIVHITDTVLLPLSAAQFLGIDLSRVEESTMSVRST